MRSNKPWNEPTFIYRLIVNHYPSKRVYIDANELMDVIPTLEAVVGSKITVEFCEIFGTSESLDWQPWPKVE